MFFLLCVFYLLKKYPTQWVANEYNTMGSFNTKANFQRKQQIVK